SQLCYHGLLPQRLADGGPLVLAFKDFVPISLGLLPRDELVERSDVENHAIVEVLFKVQVRGTAQLFLKVPQFRDHFFLPLNLLVELPGATSPSLLRTRGSGQS